MDDLTKSLLSQALDRRSSAARWAVLLTVAAIVVHAFTFAPYVDVSQQKRATDSHLSQVNAVKTRIDALAPSLQAAADALHEQGQRLGEGLRQSLLQDFARLEASRRQALTGQASIGAPPSPPLPAEPAPGPPSPIQMPLQPPAAPEPFDISDPAFRAALATVERGPMLQRLEPFVRRLVVEPRYQALNRQWAETVAPALAGDIDKVASQAAALSSRAPPEFVADLDRFRASLAATKQKIAGLRFAPPAADRWWTSAVGKGAAGASISADVLAFQAPLTQELQGLVDSVDSAVAAQKALSAEQAAQLEAMRQAFVEQVATLTSLSEPLGVLRFDLARFVPVAPLMIGLLVGALALWNGIAHWRLAALLDWARDHGEIGVDQLALLGRATGLPGAALPSAGGPRAALLPSLVAAAGVAWVLIAGVEAASLEGWPALWPQTAIGVVAVLGGSAYLAVCRRPARRRRGASAA